MAKKKSKSTTPNRKRMSRQAHLSSAKAWLASYQGKSPVRGYAKWFGVSRLCALLELRKIGLNISEAQIQEEKRAEERIATSRALAKQRKEQAEAELDFDYCDEHCSFIAGYTSGGVPYGVTWEEARDLARQPGEEIPDLGRPDTSIDYADDPLADTGNPGSDSWTDAKALGMALLLSLSPGCSNDARQPDNPHVGDMYDTSYSGQVTPQRVKYRINAQGEKIRIDRYAGLFVWTDYAAPWCAPCTPQARVIHRLERAWPDRVVFVTIMTSESAGYEDIPDQRSARTWAARFELEPSMVVAATDQWSRTVPAHLLYSPQGHTLFAHTGGMTEEQIREVVTRYTADWERWRDSGEQAGWMH